MIDLLNQSKALLGGLVFVLAVILCLLVIDAIARSDEDDLD